MKIGLWARKMEISTPIVMHQRPPHSFIRLPLEATKVRVLKILYNGFNQSYFKIEDLKFTYNMLYFVFFY